MQISKSKTEVHKLKIWYEFGYIYKTEVNEKGELPQGTSLFSLKSVIKIQMFHFYSFLFFQKYVYLFCLSKKEEIKQLI